MGLFGKAFKRRPPSREEGRAGRPAEQDTEDAAAAVPSESDSVYNHHKGSSLLNSTGSMYRNGENSLFNRWQ